MSYSKAQVITLGAVFGLLPIPFVALRFYARHITCAKYGIDDWLLFTALLFNLATGAVLVADACVGELGSHQPQVYGADGELIHHEALKNYEKMKFSIQLLNIALIGMSRLSVLFLYRRIFSIRVFRLACNVVIAIVVCWIVGFFAATVFQCQPTSVIWEKFEYEYMNYCVQVVPFYYAISITDTLTDVLIMALPLPMIWRLKLAVQQRVALAGIFLLGALVVAASLARVFVFLQVGQELMIHFTDVTYYTAPVFFWSTIEGSLSCISACLPTLRPVLIRFFPRSISGSSSIKPTGSSSLGASMSRSNRSARLGKSDATIDDGDTELRSVCSTTDLNRSAGAPFDVTGNGQNGAFRTQVYGEKGVGGKESQWRSGSSYRHGSTYEGSGATSRCEYGHPIRMPDSREEERGIRVQKEVMLEREAV